MDVREVCMAVTQRFVMMLVRMRLDFLPSRGVCMLMMLIVPVGMVVRERLVQVFVFVVFGGVQPDTDSHQTRRQIED